MNTQPNHVRILTNTEDLVAYCRADKDYYSPEPPDAWDESTDTNRPRVLILGFDTETDLEAELAVQAIQGFVLRRTTMTHPVFSYRDERS